ncbi:sulfite exporter TauE/SafE family protein [Alkalicoccus luteus]|uniref:Probable membrane transporter protein n=1 Tax=Alkalicoccus luteus TaxID=1237094 RepID=A0A969PVM3_9BACI|nr:sulfite exporter TauE/SafE family protein [Alkalicoccus luteus]NJP38329.1 sulfite exporter TauE/SafE family protein [Alkalicoccus luteus]
MWIELLLITIILLAGSFVQGVSGFGFGLIAMSFMPLIFTVKDSTLLVVSLALVVCTSIAWQLRRHIVWRSLLVILSAAFVGRFGGFLVLSAYGELDVMRDILGLFLLLVTAYLFFGSKYAQMLPKETIWIPVVFGFLGGFVGGIYAVGGPFFVVVMMLLFADSKYRYSANLQVTFFVTNLTTVLLHAFNGDFSSEFPFYFAVGLLTVLVGTRLGVACFKKLSQDNMRRIAGITVALAAVNLIFFQ